MTRQEQIQQWIDNKLEQICHADDLAQLAEEGYEVVVRKKVEHDPLPVGDFDKFMKSLGA